MRTPCLPLLVLAATACKKVEAAPPDLNVILRDLFVSYAEGDDAALTALVEAWLPLIDPDALAEAPVDGSQTRLDPEAQASADLRAPPDDDGSWKLPDPALARPIFLANRFTCALDQLERVLIDLDQQALFGGYDTYTRTWDGSGEDFLAGAVDELSWEAEAGASYFGAGSYVEVLLGGVRRAPLPEGVEGEHALLGRTYIPFPATNLSGAIDFRQDYQIELYVPWGDGEVLHLYGIWRELELGALGSMESDAVARVTLNNLANWDEKTEALCAEGRP